MLIEPARIESAMIENVELNLRHLGLGDLDEFGLLTLFADVQAHWLVRGTGHDLRGICDAGGAPLYPAFYRTHVRVPPRRLLSGHRLWSHVDAGVDVRSFGGLLLESRYVLAPGGQAPRDPGEWDAAVHPTMSASSMFIIDDLSRFPQASGPADGATAEIERAAAPPEAMNTFRRLRAGGALEPWGASDLDEGSAVVGYDVAPRRDAAPGHNMMFAQYVRLMDHAEQSLLRAAGGPGLPAGVLDSLETLERETYYFGNCQAGERVRVRLAGGFAPVPDALGAPPDGVAFAALLHWNMELCRDGGAGEPDRLALSRCRKVVALPADRADLLGAATDLTSRLWDGDEAERTAGPAGRAS